jgi:predicted ArsR family transcriptional regulator
MSSDRQDRPSRAAGAAGERLLARLKTRGPQTAGELGAALGITGEAVRQQLAKLAAEALVEGRAEPRGVGRPAQVWALTEAGNARFPDTHARLTVQLLDSVRTVLGAEALERLIAAREETTRASYAAELESAADLEERIARLAEIRSREGYMAEWRAEGAGFVLIENHCPICAAAAACPGLCLAELRSFRELLGPGVEIERTEHIVEGQRRCVYRIESVE